MFLRLELQIRAQLILRIVDAEVLSPVFDILDMILFFLLQDSRFSFHNPLSELSMFLKLVSFSDSIFIVYPVFILI
jgi:hypothetical protein